MLRMTKVLAPTEEIDRFWKRLVTEVAAPKVRHFSRLPTFLIIN
jgi:hypothetical protein